MKTKIFPARIHVLLARESHTAVIIRRGPSKTVASMLWDRSNDTFSMGQWLKGRIYERRSDLSPNGRHLIYFAMKGSSAKFSWTAVSRAPYLKALDFIEKGDCWEGGGLFSSDASYWLNDRYYSQNKMLDMKSGLKCDPNTRPETHFGAECTGVYYPRLIRDGWTLTKRSERGQWDSETVFEKHLTGNWILRKIAHEQIGSPVGKGCYWDEHEIENTKSDNIIRCPDWEWAEWDQGKLIWAELGKLYRAGIGDETSLEPPKMLHDFTPHEFEAIAAPY